MHTNKPEEAKGVFGVQVDDPSIGDAVYFGSTTVKKLPDVIKHINNSYFLSEEVDMYYVVTETLHIAGKNAPNKEDMDFLLKAIDAALGQSDKVWLNTGSAYLSVVAKLRGVNQ